MSTGRVGARRPKAEDARPDGRCAAHGMAPVLVAPAAFVSTRHYGSESMLGELGHWVARAAVWRVLWVIPLPVVIVLGVLGYALYRLRRGRRAAAPPG